MAEYIDREKLISKVKNNYIEDAKNGYDYYDYLLQDDLVSEPTADVIERSEYNFLKQENKELAIKYDNAMNKVINSEAALKRLRSKIDKAIEEIEKCKVYGRTDCARLVSLPEILNILKEI